MQQQEGQLIEKWLKEDKLESTEELCDIVKPLDTRAALSISVRGQSHQKVINSLVETGQTVRSSRTSRRWAPGRLPHDALSMVSVNPQGATDREGPAWERRALIEATWL